MGIRNGEEGERGREMGRGEERVGREGIRVKGDIIQIKQGKKKIVYILPEGFEHGRRG